MEGFFRNGEGDEVIFVHEGSARSRRSSATCRTSRATTSSSRAAPRTASARRARQRYLVFETPGLITIPRRYRNEYGQLMEHAPYYHRDIHPPTSCTPTASAASSSSRCACATATRLRPRLPPVRRRRLGRLRLPVDVLDPRLRADHRAHPHAAAVAPDVPGAQLRHLLVLPAQARLRPAGDPDPVPPLEPAVRGDDLLRRRELLVAQGDRDRHRTLHPSACRTGRTRVSRRSRSG